MSARPDGAPMRVVAAVIPGARPGEVLVFRRAAHKRHGGLWEFPGGQIEPGEAAPAALRRELAEELGVVAAVREPPLWRGRIADPPLEISFFATEIEAGVPTPDGTDHDAVRSLSEPALRALALAPADVPFVDWLLAGDSA